MKHVLISILYISLFSNCSHKQIELEKNPPRIPASPSSTNREADSCEGPLSSTDQELLKQYFSDSTRLQWAGRPISEQMELASAYSKQLSDNALLKLTAAMRKLQLLQIGKALEQNPELSKQFLKISENIVNADKARELYQNANFFEILHGKKQDRFLFASNVLARSVYDFSALLRKNPILHEETKKFMLQGIYKALLAEAKIDAQVIDQIILKVEKGAAVIKVTRNTSIGLGLIVGGLITAGTSTPVGAAMLTATGSAAFATFSAAATSAVATSAIASGYVLTKGNLSLVAKSILAEEDFGCRLIQEHKEHDKAIWAKTLFTAKAAAAIGGTLGLGYAAGGVYYSIALAIDSATFVGFIGYASYAAIRDGRSAYMTFEEAKKAAMEGREDDARNLITLAHAKVVASGTSALDAAFFSFRAAPTFAALKTQISHPPNGFLNQLQIVAPVPATVAN